MSDLVQIRLEAPTVFVLMGPSGVGKSTVLRCLEGRAGVDSAPKYTTRSSRGTEEDARDFIFCRPGDFPSGHPDVLSFQSYGHMFGIQISAIERSFSSQRHHAIVTDDIEVVGQLSALFGNHLFPVLIFCEASVLHQRIFAVGSSPQREQRWSQIQTDMENIHKFLPVVRYVINNNGSAAETEQQIDRLLAMRGSVGAHK